jgi:RNA polymerase sigma factor (sigma-70 family)
MGKGQTGSVLHYLRGLFRAPAAAHSDRELLRAFAGRRDETAFAALVGRHASLVWGVCRRLLRDEQDAEDAFQATFLVLARKAGSVPWREDAGNWLYAVALRVARQARARAARRRRRDSEVVMAPQPTADEGPDADVSAAVAEEVGRLPDKYRRPVVLCYLQGKTYPEAAQLLGWPEGTVSGRLARARDILRRRLTRRGLALPAGVAALLAAEATEAAAPGTLVQVTIRVAMGPEASSAAVALAEEVIRAMFYSRLRSVGAVVLALAVIGTGLGVWAHGRNEPPAPAPEAPPAPAPREAEAANPGPPAAWAGRWVADPFAGAVALEVHHAQQGTGVPRVYHIKDADKVAAVLKAAKITGIQNDMFAGCIPTATLIVHRRDGTTFRAAFNGSGCVSCDTGTISVDEGLIAALGRAVGDGTKPVDLTQFLPAPPGAFVEPTPPPSPKSLTSGFTSLEVTFLLGNQLHRTRFTDEKTLDALHKTLTVVKVEPLGNEPVEVIGVNVVCKDKAVFRLQFRGRETLADNDVGKLTVAPAFVKALDKEVSRRAGCEIDVTAQNNALPERMRERASAFRKLLGEAEALRYREKRDDQEVSVRVDDPKELAKVVNSLGQVEGVPAELKLPKWRATLELTLKGGRTLTLPFLDPGKNLHDAESLAAMPFLSELLEVPGVGQVWIDNQWRSKFTDLAFDRQRQAKMRRDIETSRLVCRDLPAFGKLVLSVAVHYQEGESQLQGLLPQEQVAAVVALVTAGKFERLDWDDERWEKELTDLAERGAGELMLAPGLGFDLPLVVSAEKEMLVPMCGRLTFGESPLPKLRKAIDADKAESVHLLPRPKE